MSVSSHLNPEPERRLWIIHENLKRTLEWTDVKSACVAAFCAAQALAAVRFLPGGGALSFASASLSLGALAGLLGLSPLVEMRRKVPLADAGRDKRPTGDPLLSPQEIARYPQMELVILLDRYLGGGITATPYYEDIVGEIVACARVTVRKRRFFWAACALAAAAQPALLFLILNPR